MSTYEQIADRTRAAHAIIDSTRNPIKRHVLIANEPKVWRGDWTVAEWRKHASNITYSQGPFAGMPRYRLVTRR